MYLFAKINNSPTGLSPAEVLSEIQHGILIASTMDYNAGIIHNTWIDFDQCPSLGNVWHHVLTLMKHSPHGLKHQIDVVETAQQFGLYAWAIHDNIGLGSVDVHEDIEVLWERYKSIKEGESS